MHPRAQACLMADAAGAAVGGWTPLLAHGHDFQESRFSVVAWFTLYMSSCCGKHLDTEDYLVIK